MSVDLQRADGRWLLGCFPDPAEAAAQWAAGRGVAVLPCGKVFSAVRVPTRFVQAAARATDPVGEDAYLAAVLMGGPVICDRYAGWHYALVPPSDGARWDVAETLWLGPGAVVGVPRPDITSDSGERIYWSVPVSSPGDLCAPPAVSQIVALGQYRALSR
ncbi:hypothetical protein [Streptomyces anulatus]|uniref:hypothetical protein n=1 Tax=Streptomyces anulatus TaxID=1892 RepID=UPI0036938D58